ncbi:hypothetical protein COS33_00130 [Candidatus Wolfebacteria bacterium CG02_land_8_20_14_3_00_37_12]|uniref:Sulfatase-modifying factor enzyme domain-containing protein n=2 Tax=Candidatus Wolfeibacteriota TaxID=1752735 RepID=A0A2M7CQR2_9BACT|nr:MAG: hypothetical protein COS33_00130 [Candidatus Wolfebacteria bacterium CG02_land_8_20_14_3_00_37_12]PJA41639.1 MAG: hypothetical protein CO177_01240 [Candidatus Wolfebacteria bacterium CG_4_9_14_3_um_filter_37_9]
MNNNKIQILAVATAFLVIGVGIAVFVQIYVGSLVETPSLGTDMLNQYFMESGLFTPHSSATCDGTEAFVEIKSGSNKGYCIEKNERVAEHWEDAKYTCANAGKRLSEPFEWKFACQNAETLGLSAMTGNWEWASNFSLPLYDVNSSGVGSSVFGSSGCGYATWGWVGYNTGNEASLAFRCVR